MRLLRRRRRDTVMMLLIAFMYCSVLLLLKINTDVLKMSLRVNNIDQDIEKSAKHQGRKEFEKSGNTWKKYSDSENCIAAVVLLRIYAGDKSELTTLEVEQWIRYLQYAGVDIVYMYDAFEEDSENLESWVQELFLPTEVVYHNWHFFTPYEVLKTQVSAYQHATNAYNLSCKWHLAMDIDEYPFVLSDHKPGFLKRLVSNITTVNTNCSEISFKNTLFAGYPKNCSWLIQRYQRRFPKTYNSLDKPLYIAEDIESVGVHHNYLRNGVSVDVEVGVARMNQYWGARHQNWTYDSEETIRQTIPDSSMLTLLEQIRETPIRSTLLRSNVTNRFWKLNIGKKRHSELDN